MTNSSDIQIADYDESNIFTPEGLDHVRMRTTAYVHSRGVEGLIHQANELFINAADELALMPDGKGKLIVLVCDDKINNTYQVIIKDNGRGLPIGKLVDSYTKLRTSGKYDTKAYESSGGLYGVGGKLAAGISAYFKAITYRHDGVAAVNIEEGKLKGKLDRIENKYNETGVTVVYQPDPMIMTDIDKFSSEGIPKLILLLQKFCFFRRLDVEFRIQHFGLDNNFWKLSIDKSHKVIRDIINASELVFTESSFDRQTWLKKYWELTRPFAYSLNIADKFISKLVSIDRVEQDTTIRYQAQLHYVKFDQVGGRFGLLNNLPIDDAKSTHLLTIVDEVKFLMSDLITNVAKKKFFLETYKLPIYIAVTVSCPGAEPSGTLKDTFFSTSFRKVYSPSIRQQLKLHGEQFLKDLFKDLETDIDNAYARFTKSETKIKNTNRIFDELNFPTRLSDCESADRLNTELFLVEGLSAAGGEGRNKTHQGQYALRGKTLNAITTKENTEETIRLLKNNDIYQDILKVMGVNPLHFDPDTMYFKKGFITTDADIHGYHIASIVISNLYVLCPAMIEAGVWSVITPPLYSLDYKGKKKGMPRVYLRDDKEIKYWLIKNCFSNAFKIGITSRFGFTKLRYLNDIDYHDLCMILLDLGEQIENIANELVLPEEIVEALSYVTNYLTPQTMDADLICNKLGFTKVSYNRDTNIMVVTIRKEDYIIPLENISNRLYETVLPLFRRIAWNKLQLYITSIHTNTYKDQPISVVQLYRIMKSFNDEFTINRYKGLASMPALDRNRTCMDPKYRSVHHITSVGDVDMIFKLLGSDSNERKQLVDGSSL